MPAATTNSATTRPLRLRVRGELVVVEQRFGGRRYWAVKDPVALRYWHLRDEEYAVLRLLDGEASIESIRTEFERRFAPRRLSVRDLEAFLVQLHTEGLVVAATPGQGPELLERATKTRSRKRWAALANPLAIRFPGIDPTAIVEELYVWTRWMFSRWFAVVCVGTVVGAVGLVASNASSVSRRLPEFQQLFELGNLPSLVVALAVVKMLHELGHAVACRHHGGRCHELGLLLLVLTPTLYCNVSDSWMIADKWKRIAIGAAGVCVELVLAAACTFLWYFSVPGVFNGLCLNVMFVCSVSTLLFNANPLLRYDGYYVLFDWLEVPNARQRSMSLVGGSLGRFFLGIEPPRQRWVPDRLKTFLVGYAVAAVLYRVFVVAGILWVFKKTMEPYRLEALAYVMAALVVSGMVAGPAYRAVTFLLDAGRRSEVKWNRFLVRGGLVLGLGAVVLWVPLPARVTTAVLVQPRGAETVYVTTPGRLTFAARPGSEAVAGETLLGRLENARVELELTRLDAERTDRRKELDTLLARRNTDPEAEAAVPTAEKALADAETRYEQRLRDRDELTLLAPVDGVVLPPPVAPDDGERHWSGHPLEERNLGAFLAAGTPFCLVGDPGRLEAVLVVDQSDVEFVREEQVVSLRFEELPNETVTGTVVELAEIDLDVVPPPLLRHVDVPVVMENGRPRPLSTSYLARIRFAVDPRVPIGATGRAAIRIAPRSLGQRLVRFVRRTFRFGW